MLDEQTEDTEIVFVEIGDAEAPCEILEQDDLTTKYVFLRGTELDKVLAEWVDIVFEQYPPPREAYEDNARNVCLDGEEHFLVLVDEDLGDDGTGAGTFTVVEYDSFEEWYDENG